mmetsp:Transcript_10231/g.33787  ORF Transcript_10231/g.33787 Transcript_10231/m.33787 type:complete len:222 (+) Transcript_10231:1018-1683(+)
MVRGDGVEFVVARPGRRGPRGLGEPRPHGLLHPLPHPRRPPPRDVRPAYSHAVRDGPDVPGGDGAQDDPPELLPLLRRNRLRLHLQRPRPRRQGGRPPRRRHEGQARPHAPKPRRHHRRRGRRDRLRRTLLPRTRRPRPGPRHVHRQAHETYPTRRRHQLQGPGITIPRRMGREALRSQKALPLQTHRPRTRRLLLLEGIFLLTSLTSLTVCRLPPGLGSE